MQRALHQTLAARGRRFADPGDVVETGPFGLNFRAVLHAVAINALYETSVPLVRDVVTASLEAAAKLGARQVALTALATGYGRMSITDFGLACRPLAGESFPPVEQVIVCVRHPAEREVLAETLGLDL
jgi:O-acetyl-ADP-ribose deacetylase (regulator of RNase III)